MSLAGFLPPTTNFGTWTENIEIVDVTDGSLVDLSDVDEITLILRDPYTKSDELTLTMTNGDITVPQTGIIQWRAEAEAMGALDSGTYTVVLIVEDEDDTIPLILGSISILE